MADAAAGKNGDNGALVAETTPGETETGEAPTALAVVTVRLIQLTNEALRFCFLLLFSFLWRRHECPNALLSSFLLLLFSSHSARDAAMAGGTSR